MTNQDQIPAGFGRPFLEWLRGATESAWSRVRTPTLADFQECGVGGSSWRRGTTWSGGLSDVEIAEVESRFGIRFSAPHRLFLQVLHATEPLCSGARFVGQQLTAVDGPGFYHWLRDEDAIRRAFGWLVDGLVFDVENNALWPASWGTRPGDAEARRARVRGLVAQAPPLLPIYSHRYVLAAGPPLVLSVHQSDIIVYGCDLRAYLLHELHRLLGIPDDPTWMEANVQAIPFWGELMLLA